MEYEEISVLSSDTEQVKDLKRQIMSLRAQLDAQKQISSNLRGGNLLNSESIDYYQGEQLDFVLSVLSQLRERCPQDSRSRDIIDSLLSVNKPIGRGEEIRKEVQRIFSKGDPTTEADISALRALGFTYTPSRKHPKLRFHEKYMFVLASTPSDNRHGAKNKLSEINKCIAVAQKV